MSLDVHLTLRGHVNPAGSGIFIRENGSMRELTRAEWDEKHPGQEPVIAISEDDDRVYDANITHNLGGMAAEAGIYQHLWRPEELGITHAKQLIEPLRAGLGLMKADPPRFEKHNASNGWGLYEHFVPWIERYLAACEEYPEAEISVSR